MQLDLWGLDYFDLFLVHFPIALAYVEPEHRYPPEWWGDDRKVHLRAFQYSFNYHFLSGILRLLMPKEKTPLQETWGAMEGLVDDGLVRNIGVRLAHPKQFFIYLNFAE